ncbi:hypothetical protein PUN28_009043 [Cardiocondyla obscurior]|uniref:t-SNARE coiled-coil homology domain-containing protein n=1 Tax=Cardiocondyla obscurior TaxID=286306 RepID=A0AAW2FVP2_9HYME
MRSDADLDTDIEIRVQKTLLSINDISLKIKKELRMIEELVKENGHLHTVVDVANQKLSKKAQDMDMNVANIINESKRDDRLQLNLLDDVTSTTTTEKLKNHTKS